MEYFFILGSNPALSLAEINSVLKPDNIRLLSESFLLVKSQVKLNISELMLRLGGSIKVGLIKGENVKEHQLFNFAYKLIEDKRSQSEGGKFNFGISDYSGNLNSAKLGIRLKKELSGRKISARFVTSKEQTLSSVVVRQNKIIKRGLEVVVFKTSNGFIVGQTEAVQPFKSLSFRDFGRPARDDMSGMLPPKLAQVMLNLADIKENDDVILDPFCGSGTIITEALLMGYKNILASDISEKAVSDTRENIAWIKDKYQVSAEKVQVNRKNVVDLAKSIKINSVSVIVTEPYLGPQRGKIEFEEVKKELEGLYSQAIAQFKQILSDKGRVVMVWPVFFGNRFIDPNISGFKIEKVIPEDRDEAYSKIINRYLGKRANVVYGRKGQKVYREIVVLSKI